MQQRKRHSVAMLARIAAVLRDRQAVRHSLMSRCHRDFSKHIETHPFEVFPEYLPKAWPRSSYDPQPL